MAVLRAASSRISKGSQPLLPLARTAPATPGAPAVWRAKVWRVRPGTVVAVTAPSMPVPVTAVSVSVQAGRPPAAPPRPAPGAAAGRLGPGAPAVRRATVGRSRPGAVGAVTAPSRPVPVTAVSVSVQAGRPPAAQSGSVRVVEVVVWVEPSALAA